jgi:amino acid adenylation domain-containing protein
MRANVLEYLEGSAATHPTSCAVIDEHTSLTYTQLHDACRRVGSALASADVFGRGVIVCMEKGADALSAQLGVLYAGGHYVPVDPGIPAERLRSIVGAVGQTSIIVDETTEQRVREMDLGLSVCSFADLAGHAIDEDALLAIRGKSIETMPAYVLFTSGSTGVPKGVVISHHAIISFIDAFVGTLGIRDTDRLGNQAPFDFDVSTKDIYSTLAASATLVIIPRRLFMQPADLAAYLEERRVTVLIWAVAALCLVSTYHALDVADFSSIRTVMFSGETMPKRHLKSWRSHLPEATFVNLYGPTEITCNCLYHVLDPDYPYEEGVPLGVPFSHCDVILADDEGHEVSEPGVEGNLLVRGPSLALGYLGQPELTSKAFGQNPLNDRYPDRVYNTGDVASFDEQGMLFFRGRRDNQIKYQGHRIELEDIEHAIEKLPGVDRCRCVFNAKRKLLHAFFEGTAQEKELSEKVRATLPSFMQPATLRHIDEMPLTKNGKVDRAQLAGMLHTRRTGR